ncbi:hypothetical protein HS088_TW10G00544 [Tripterygium wilfordii]|uniref:DUF3511 domain protein n=1 Tax=Tripterygium wilfordii TaxID=458696 RepID=A0A7J7D5D1_TRIWF|nr:uncharacterized protein LOC120007872 [Tripterygium wilfordii]KAF5741544.1 hypothetical protein HS088_TW10G00544 [Tripterygium wilfordii]
MDGFGSGSGSRQWSNPSDRRLEIVSGKSFGNASQIYVAKPHSPNRPPPQIKPREVASKPWGFGDPEMKRKKRIAKYKVYTVEGNVKASFNKGLRWIKNQCSKLVRGY